MNPIISVRGLCVAYGANEVLKGIDLDIEPGSFVALLGASGCGKTTLLRTLSGFNPVKAGSITVKGQDILHEPPERRGMAMVFQSYALWSHMSVAQNIGYGLRIRPRAQRPSPADIDKRVSDLLDMMQLSGFGSRYPSQLSGGQRQRVALARALAVEPRVLLLDEPFGALDAQVRKDLRSWLREIHDRTGHTTVFVTHDQDEALELSDRVAILNRGRIEQIGSPDEVYDNPQTPFVFGFIGESNQIKVEIQAGQAWLGGKPLDVPPVQAPDGPGVTFFRPQHGDLAPPEAPGLPGILKAIHRVGPLVRARVQLEAAPALFDVALPVGRELAPGARISMQIRQSRTFPVDQGAG